MVRGDTAARTGGRREVVGDRIDVHELGDGPEPRDAAGRRKERIRAGDHFVAGTDAQRHHRDEERVGARRHADGIGDFQRFRQLTFERLDLRPLYETLTVADTSDRVEYLLTDRTVLSLEIEERYFCSNGHGHD